MKTIKLINPDNVSDEEVKSYDAREAGRAVVIDEEGMIGLLHVTKDNYYKLPGGGIEGSEDRIVALQRECREEIGCDVVIVGELGCIVEYRKECKLKQISYCYVARVTGVKGQSNLTDEEKENGFEQVWLRYDEALKLLSESKSAIVEVSAYIVPRDSAFLELARELL